MKKQKVRRLTLHRETLKQLDDPTLQAQAGAGAAGLSTQCSFVCCPVDTVDPCTAA